MKKGKRNKEVWETPSLTWIHQIRRERQRERAGRPLFPLSRKESERLAEKYGLKLDRSTTLERAR
jgi:hypothetical protein